MNVLKSYVCKNIDDSTVKRVLDKVTYDDNKTVGKCIKNGWYDTVVLCEDSVASTIGYGSGKLYTIPTCICKLIDYIRSLYESSFEISSFSIYEGYRGKVVIDMVVSKSNEVYGYSFYIRNDRVEYDDYLPESSISSLNEQYFPSIESEEPNAEIINKLVYDVLDFCGRLKFPIKRVAVFSESSDIITFGKKCIFGIGNSKNYYGVLYAFEEEDTVYNMDEGEYDLCILIKD